VNDKISVASRLTASPQIYTPIGGLPQETSADEFQALKRRKPGLVVGQHGRLDFLAVEFATVVLRQPVPDDIGRQAVLVYSDLRTAA